MRTNKLVYFLKGIQASGKSTFANGMKELNPLTTFVSNKDSLRKDNPSFSENAILALERKLVENEMNNNEDNETIIIDNTHFNPIHYEYYSSLAKKYGYAFVVKEFKTPLETCILRNEQRENKVPVETILEIGDKSGWYPGEVKKYREKDFVIQNSILPYCVIVDIDGTVANMDKRSPYDYSPGAVLADKPKTDVISVVRALAKDNIVIFVSGRNEVCREDTIKWLDNWVGLKDYYLIMRRREDKRKDYVVKEEIFRDKILPFYYARVVLDDRNSVVAMWRRIGLTCLQVNYGDF